jgi:hypothetical protein
VVKVAQADGLVAASHPGAASGQRAAAGDLHGKGDAACGQRAKENAIN